MLRWLLCLVATAAPLLAQNAATPETVLKFHDARMAGVKSWQANFSKMATQGPLTVSQSGTVRFVRMPTGAEKGRADFIMQMAGRDLNYRIVSGTDNVVWQLVSSGNRTATYKLDLNRPIIGSQQDPHAINPINEVNPHAILKQNRTQFDFTLDGLQEVGGRRVFQLVGKPKTTAGAVQSPIGSLRLGIGADDGFLYRLVVSDMRGNPALVIELNGVRVNLELEDSLFTYVPPEGANIQDLNARLGKAIQ